jgi:xanthine dehydrogenase YagS FAD-binding subunit
MLPGFSYVRPSTVAEAVRHLSSPDARAHAGGTDLIGTLRDGADSARTVVSLSGLSELRGIAPLADGGLRLGALATLAEVAAHETVRERYAALAQGAAAAASPQIRNQGTLGGNICQRPRCWYYRGDFDCPRKGGAACFAPGGENQYHAIFGADGCYMVHPSDTAAPLVALEAAVRIVGKSGPRVVPMESFFILPGQDLTRENVLVPGEIVTEIVLPQPRPGSKSSYRKFRARAAWDFALAGAAVALQVSGGKVARARVVLSGVAPAPWRSRAAEAALVGTALGAASASRAASAATEGAEPLELNAYKVDLVRAMVEDAVMVLA